MGNRFTSNISNIAVIGGGNIGTLFACFCAAKGYCVNLFSSKPDEFDGILEAVDENGSVTVGALSKVTSDMAEAVRGCQLILVTYPAFMLREAAEAMLPHITPEATICVVPGTGGAEFVFADCMAMGASLCGLQRVPVVARLEVYGKRVRHAGLRDELCLGAIPGSCANAIAGFMSELWGIPCRVLPNYLSVTLTPSNPILHTTRLRTLFSDYAEGMVYNRVPLFYGEWNDDSSRLLIACDAELQSLCRALDRLDLSGVRSLKLHYESASAEALTKKLRSIKSLNHIPAPMKKAAGGWIPEFESRYFAADFPYGLAIIEGFAKAVGVNAPNINETMAWYRSVTGYRGGFDLAAHGILSKEVIYGLYGSQ